MIDSVDSPYILAANTDNFQQLVLDNSKKGPVLVNFWSKKAGPCLRQYPILDKIIHHYDGLALLVNVDTETEIALTSDYGITSVPTLKLFRDGQVVETLHGYQSETELLSVLDKYVARDSDQVLVDAIHQYTEGNATKAYQMIADAIAQDPINPRLPLTMCKLLKHEQRYEEAMKLIDSLPDHLRNDREITQLYDLLSYYQEADTSQNISRLAEQVISSPGDIEAKKQLSIHYVITEQYEKALQQLVEIMELDAAFRDNYAQKSMLKVFNIVGTDSDLASKFRPNLKRYIH